MLMPVVAGLFRHRIVSAATPGVATYYSLDAEPSAYNKASFLQGLNGVMGTTWLIAAYRRQ